jgi:hypothetical protein
MLEPQESAPFVKWTSIPLTPIIVIIIIIIVIRAFARIVPGSTKLIHTISKRKAAVVMDDPTIILSIMLNLSDKLIAGQKCKSYSCGLAMQNGYH